MSHKLSRPSLGSARDHRLSTPSRIPRPSSSLSNQQSAGSSSTASYARTSSPSRAISRKRPRVTSASTPGMHTSPYNISPSTTASYFNYAPNHTPNAPTLSPSIYPHQHRLESPPPLANSRYDLAHGMDTPMALAERLADSTSMDVDTLDGRFGRAQLSKYNSYPNHNPDSTHILGSDRNGKGRRPSQESFAPPGDRRHGWGVSLLNVVGGVATGLWNFWKATAFAGFQSGGGQAYNSTGTPIRRMDSWTSENNWEDEHEQLSRSWDRLPTPVPGEYPETPPSDEEESRGKKRQHTDGGGWIVVEKTKEQSLTKNSGHVPARLTPSRASYHVSRQIKPPSLSRRSTNTSYVGSPHAPTVFQPPIHKRHSSHYVTQSLQRPKTPIETTSPPSVEVRKFQKRMRREEKQSEQKFEMMNERLQEMIKQGREALGSRVEVVDDDPSDTQMQW